MCVQEHAIQAVSADGLTITLAQPLRYTHWGADGMFAEVGLLSRNIVFRGEPFDNTDSEVTYGGHVIISTASTVHVVGAEFTGMGQHLIMARYRTCRL